MLDAAAGALANVANPENFGFLLIGVLIGVWVGIVPGVGSMVGIAVMLPFLYGMEPVAGIFMLIGITAVNNTSDSFPAVLFGIPGGSSSAATIMDGHPLARMGQAGRALGAAFTSSMLGGIIGALVLLMILPIARPLVLALGSPELLMLSLLGIATVGMVARGSALLGVLAAVFGLALASIGTATTVLEYRFTFDSLFLQDGLSLIVVALGLFGVPELLQLLTQNRAIASTGATVDRSGLLDGAKDTFRHFGVVLRGGALGSSLGIVPGVGGSIISWLAWSTAAFSKKNKVPLGKGEIRGVIAPESANNAVDGGALIPTLMFGIPGSGSMAILLGGLVLMGVETGPSIIQGEGLVLVVSIVLALCIANILATTMCFGLARWMAKLSFIRGKVIVPFMVITLTLASFQDGFHFGLIWTLLVLGTIGWIMLCLGIPRAPVLIGFVLGPSIERYLWISMSRYDTEWLTFPGVLIIGALLALLVVGSVLMSRRDRRRTRGPGVGRDSRPSQSTEVR